MNTIDEIFRLLEERGQGSYFGEPVSQLEHALQCADFARQEQGSNELVVAALLHDVGHLLHEQGEDIADRDIDAAHENLGQWWLSRYFGRAVTRPIALHVAAKRYLCTTDESYLARLSPVSQKSLRLQGGVMSAGEVANFESDEFARDAVRLRRWDDLAKMQGKNVPSLRQYRGALESVWKPTFRASSGP
jgi:[1-hydroxy-2-(trimethylamino)ethyl]phosphonate dioxygenase